MMRHIAAVRLLYPQRDGLRHQVARLQGGRHMDSVDQEVVVAADAGTPVDPLRQERISGQWGIQLNQSVSLERARPDRADDFCDAHAFEMPDWFSSLSARPPSI